MTTNTTTAAVAQGVTKVNVELVEGLVRVIVAHQYQMEEADVCEEAKAYSEFCEEFDKKFPISIAMKTSTHYDKETGVDMIIRETFYSWRYDRRIVLHLKTLFPDSEMNENDVMFFWDESKE